MSIPRGLIRKMADDNTVYNRGLSLAAKPISYTATPTRFANLFQVTADFAEEGCRTVIEIDNENEQIEKTDCSCGTHAHQTGVCRHVVALLIKIENDFFSAEFARGGKAQRPVATDEACKALMERRAALLKNRALHRAGGHAALLLPQLHLTRNSVRLGFKAGCKRAYTVKNLEELYQALARGITAPCGKADSFLYVPENFQDEALVRFFMSYYPLCADNDHPRYMRLTPEALDSFMSLFYERKLPCDGEALSVTGMAPAFSLFIRRSGDCYILSLDRRDFTLYQGTQRLYIRQGDSLYICERDYADACGGLLRRFAGSETNPTITAEDMRTFYSIVLRPATGFITIEAREQDFIPPALKTKIYLDIEKDQTVTAKTEFYYDALCYHAFDPDRDLRTVWDIEGETRVEKLVKAYFPESGKEPGTSVLPPDEEALFDLMHEGIPALSACAALYISGGLRAVKLKDFPKAQLGVRLESQLLKVDVSAGELPASILTAALVAYRQRKKYLRLKDGSFLLLDSVNLSRLDRVADGLGLSTSDLKKKEVTVPAYRTLYLDSVTEVDIVKDNSFTALADAFTRPESELPALPDSLQQVLRDYQKHGYRWLYTLARCGFGGILADDMGLGKTLQVLSLLTAFKEAHGSCRAFVVCPASLVLNWEQEIRRFTPALRSVCVLGTTAERNAIITAREQADVLITSYDLLKRDIAGYRHMTFDFEIIDEAQYIKNHNTQNARSVKAVQAANRFALTGTPIENTVAELWSIFDFIMPGYLYKYARFRQRFELPIVKEGDRTALEELKRMTAPFILRRLKKDVLTELPEKTETVLYTRLAPEQNKLYQINLVAILKELETQLSTESLGKSRLMVLAMLTRLRQLCCDPSLLYENYRENSAKFDLCMNLVESSVASGHKILIFSQFTSMLAILERSLREKQIPCYLIEGATKKEDRIARVSAFNHDDTPVFLISLKAGGTGLNLTGADVVIHYDPWWNLSAQNQATDRAHRIGQKNSVSVYKLIAKDSIEEKIMALAEKKQSLAEQVLPDEGGILQGLSKDEILNLFRG